MSQGPTMQPMSEQAREALPRLITPAALAEIMDVSESTVEEWIRKKLLPSFKVGRVRRFACSDVLAFIGRYTVRQKAIHLRQGYGGQAVQSPADSQLLWERIERLIAERMQNAECKMHKTEEIAA